MRVVLVCDHETFLREYCVIQPGAEVLDLAVGEDEIDKLSGDDDVSAAFEHVDVMREGRGCSVGASAFL
jgi:hypothetical protein